MNFLWKQRKKDTKIRELSYPPLIFDQTGLKETIRPRSDIAELGVWSEYTLLLIQQVLLAGEAVKWAASAVFSYASLLVALKSQSF